MAALNRLTILDALSDCECCIALVREVVGLMSDYYFLISLPSPFKSLGSPSKCQYLLLSFLNPLIPIVAHAMASVVIPWGGGGMAYHDLNDFGNDDKTVHVVRGVALRLYFLCWEWVCSIDG